MSSRHVIALDIGERRIGVAHGWSDIKLAQPLLTVEHDENIMATLRKLCADQQADGVVAGLPRNLNGEDTDQTRYVRRFVDELTLQLDAPIALQDEALSSSRAETELKARGKQYAKGDIDALAATYILEDFFESGAL